MDWLVEIMVLIFGVMKVGVVFLLIDLDMFEEWICYLLEDSGVRIVVVNERNMMVIG